MGPQLERGGRDIIDLRASRGLEIGQESLRGTG